MRARSIQQVARDWISEACWMNCIDNLPDSFRKKVFLCCIGNMRLGQPKQARLKVFSIISDWDVKNREPTWFDFVKPPLPAFLNHKGKIDG